MTQAEILTEFERLSIFQQLETIKAAVHIVEQHLRRQTQLEDQKLPLAEAAQLLLADYMEDEELTVFSSLDGEEIYAIE